jgi:hypothetical protein
VAHDGGRWKATSRRLPFGFALTDPGMRTCTRLFPEVTRVKRGNETPLAQARFGVVVAGVDIGIGTARQGDGKRIASELLCLELPGADAALKRRRIRNAAKDLKPDCLLTVSAIGQRDLVA